MDVPAHRRVAQFDQMSGVEQRVGIAFQTARIPGKIDRHPVEDPPGMGSRRLRRLGQLSHTKKPCSFFGGKIGADVGTVVIQELQMVSVAQLHCATIGRLTRSRVPA